MIPPPIFPKPIRLIRVEEKDGVDYFDLLPDPMVSIILNGIVDATTLCRCLVVSKRFASLVPLVDSVSVVANPRLSSSPKKIKASFSFSATLNLKSLFSKLLKTPKKPNSIGPVHLSHWISNSLNNFPRIRHLRLQLPDNGGILGFPDIPGGLLKWTAQFGKNLHRCAIIGATSFHKPPALTDSNLIPSRNHLLSDDQLRSRVVWILSCLTAACARHGVVRKALLDSPDLRSADILDARNQGRLSMNHIQIKELRQSMDLDTTDPIWKRTTVPNVIVKLWYAPELVLPTSGYVMKGATVVAIKPDTACPQDIDREYELLLRPGFGGDQAKELVIEEAVGEIVKTKWKFMYKLQMNSF